MAAHAAIAPTATLLAIFFAILPAAHLLILPAPHHALLAAVAGAISVVFGVTALLARRIAPRAAHATLAAMALLVLGNITLHMLLMQDLEQSTSHALMLVGIGFVFTSRAWFAAVTAVYLVAWVVATWPMHQQAQFVHHASLIALATLMAVVTHTVRIRSLSVVSAARDHSDAMANEANERTRATAENARQQLEEVLNHLPQAVYLRDRSGYVLCNAAFTELCGIDSADLAALGAEATRSRLPELAPVLSLDDALLDTPQVRQFECELQLDGKRRIFRVTKVPYRSPTVDGAAVLSVALEITERVRLEREKADLTEQVLLGQKLESLGVFAGGVAHDFNNLLTAILGNLSLILARGRLAEGDRNAIVAAIDATERGAHLTQQLLAYVGRDTFASEDIDVGLEIQRMSDLLRAAISSRVELVLVTDTGPCLVHGDLGKLQQVVMNLIINAAESYEDGGRVEVSVRPIALEAGRQLSSGALAAGNHARISVVDHGCGMAPEVLERIFEPFYSTKFTGRGLGLSAVIGIVNSFGGALDVSSTVGKGTRFDVYLPLTASAAVLGQAPPQPGEIAPLEVMVVDDEVQVLGLTRELLLSANCQVTIAPGGGEAIAMRAEMERADVVILDLVMPQVDGMMVLQYIDRHFPGKPVILCSGYNPQEESRTSERPNTYYLRKPFGRRELLNVLSDARPGRADEGRSVS